MNIAAKSVTSQLKHKDKNLCKDSCKNELGDSELKDSRPLNLRTNNENKRQNL